jgi:hypothetical protein
LALAALASFVGAWACFRVARDAPDSRGYGWKVLGVIVALWGLNTGGGIIDRAWWWNYGVRVDGLLQIVFPLAIALIARTFTRERFKTNYFGLKQTSTQIK